jgi:hypothetical protein
MHMNVLGFVLAVYILGRLVLSAKQSTCRGGLVPAELAI